MSNDALIIVPTDFSDLSREAIVVAISLARSLKARVLVLHACEVHDHVLPFAYLNENTRPIKKTSLEMKEASLEQWKDIYFDAPDVQVADCVVLGLAAETIVSTAQSLGAAFIVMSTHGRTGFRHLVRGSVAEEVMRTSPCPVVTVKTGATIQNSNVLQETH